MKTVEFNDCVENHVSLFNVAPEKENGYTIFNYPDSHPAIKVNAVHTLDGHLVPDEDFTKSGPNKNVSLFLTFSYTQEFGFSKSSWQSLSRFFHKDLDSTWVGRNGSFNLSLRVPSHGALDCCLDLTDLNTDYNFNAVYLPYESLKTIVLHVDRFLR
jgi:hypothetical protein